MSRGTAFRRLCALAVIALAASCSSKAADEGSTDPTSGPDSGAESTTDAVGVTADTVKISMIYADLSALSEQNLAPEIGIAKDQAEAVVAEINENGGVAGRQIELVSHVIEGAEAVLSPEAGRAACLAATEDDKPFAVVVTAAIGAEVIQCVAAEHGALTIAMDSFPESYFEEAEGRLFSVGSHLSMNRTREYRSWPGLLDEPAGLSDKTIGIIRTEEPQDEEAVEEALKPAIEELGYDVTAEAVLPCPDGSQNCAQHDAAIEKMKAGGVDFVFLTAQLLAGAATVAAAKNLNFDPEWATVGNNITKTVAQFYAPTKDAYDGAWGLDTTFLDFSDGAKACNATVVAAGGEEFPEGSDGFGFTANTCRQIQILADAIDSVDGAITHAKVISAVEGLGELDLISGPKGSLSKEKHDAGDYVFLSRYSADTEIFEPYDDRKPLKVP
jgi:ABC-type branched-subunit amino acid transport system substrate-binding protein